MASMKRLFPLACLAAGWLLAQVASTVWIPVWVGSRYQWVRLGDSLQIRDGRLEVAVQQRVRRYGVIVQPDGAGIYHYPQGVDPASVVVHINGLRATRGVDYTVVPDQYGIRLQGEWTEQPLVVLDYDLP